ncbi:MAG: hypothetical protein WBP45_12590 [Daejeonella sp.]
MAESNLKINYKAMITQYSWWRTDDGREFIIAERCGVPTDEPGVWEFTRVGLLEKYTTTIIYRPWEQFCGLVEKGIMKAIKNPKG